MSRLGEQRHAYRILARKPKGKGQRGIPGRRWEHIIQMDLKGLGFEF